MEDRAQTESPRLFTPAIPAVGTILELDAAESRHLVRVLRARVGQAVLLFDGAGGEARAELVTCDSRRAGVRIDAFRIAPEPQPALDLAIVLPRAPHMDAIVQKAVELRVARLHILCSARGLVAQAAAAEPARRERWRRLALETAKQTGSCRVPVCMPALRLETWLEREAGGIDLLLTGSLEPDSQPLRRVLESRREVPARVAVLVGPEGDFTPAEYAAARAVGALPVSFGPLRLRVESAAAFALCALRAHYDAG